MPISICWSTNERRGAPGSDSVTEEARRYAISQVMPQNVAFVNVKKNGNILLDKVLLCCRT